MEVVRAAEPETAVVARQVGDGQPIWCTDHHIASAIRLVPQACMLVVGPTIPRIVAVAHRQRRHHARRTIDIAGMVEVAAIIVEVAVAAADGIVIVASAAAVVVEAIAGAGAFLVPVVLAAVGFAVAIPVAAGVAVALAGLVVAAAAPGIAISISISAARWEGLGIHMS